MKNRKKQRRVKSHAPKWGILVAIIALCFLVYGGVQGAWAMVNSWLDDLPDVSDSSKFNYARKSTIYANDEKTVLAELFVENREPVALEEISDYVIQATVDTEDVRFYEHDGVDMMGIGRALFNNITGGDLEGASTITQQFVRNTILSEEMTDISFRRKVREAQLALNLEEIYDKNEILLMYLNTINYGDGAYGIEAAAKNYFQVSASELSLTQSATLAGIPQSPNYLNPLQYPDACLERRNAVLGRVLDAGHISQEEYDEAVQQELGLNPAPDEPVDGIYAYRHFTSYVKELLQKQEEFSHHDLFKGGLTVYTTLDPRLQDIAEQVCSDEAASLGNGLETSLVAIDPTTGYVVAMVGGQDFDQLNIAADGRRPAGSTFKTFTLVAAIEDGIDPKTPIDCGRSVTINGNTVSNMGGADHGIKTIQGATAVSSNTGYYRLADQIGTQRIIDTAEKMGVTSDLHSYLNLTLGTVDVSPLEMASAYSTLATGGIRRDSQAITKILDSEGEVVFEHFDAPYRVLTEEVSYATTEVLKTVYTQGTARAAQLPSGQVAAGKTGTSSDEMDHWLVGYTPQLVCSTWIGDRYAEKNSPGLTCANLWKRFMSQALDGSELQNFPKASDPPYENGFNKSQNKSLGKDDEKDDEKDPDTVDDPDDDTTLDPNNAKDTVGYSLEDAIDILAGYKAEKVEQYTDQIEAGYVFKQEVHGDTVRIYVSKGPEPE